MHVLVGMWLPQLGIAPIVPLNSCSTAVSKVGVVKLQLFRDPQLASSRKEVNLRLPWRQSIFVSFCNNRFFPNLEKYLKIRLLFLSTVERRSKHKAKSQILVLHVLRSTCKMVSFFFFFPSFLMALYVLPVYSK